jgi:hypothetical protein
VSLCKTSDECALCPAPAEASADIDVALTLVEVKGGDCRRHPAWDPSVLRLLGLCVLAAAREVDAHVGLIADDPGVVAGRDP